MIKLNDKISFSIFSLGEIINEFNNVIEALNAFYYLHFKYNVIADLRINLLKINEKEIKNANLQLTKYSTALEDLRNAKPLEHIANIIMANLHLYQEKNVPKYLFDFYENKNIKVELPPTLNAQTYAALLYKKSKNKHLAQNHLNKQIEEKQDLIAALADEKELITNAETHKELLIFEKISNQQSNSKTTDKTSLFHTYEIMGFKIWIGKNAKNNDVLTQKYTHKDDLWLHAKDVAGSHVVIKYQSGKPYPKPVIEKAASIAAYYSKRKTDSLCPVIYTLKKYVRKVKGSADGAVKVEKEKIIMVVPQAI